MAQYVVHKIGFWYTDECFVAGEEKGTVMGITRSLEEAQAIKSREDIKSMKNVGGFTALDFFFDHENFKGIHKKLRELYKAEFNQIIEKDNYDMVLPKSITDELAIKFLSAMELSFHNIVEYSDDEVINPADYEFDEEHDEISGF
ncbi:hypothetical protein A3860_28055 [Niastella vici]|uniref:Uncharacterized protein n=1 Tax=Niastella vici TaxID=1703345 RepID=A0A1V9FW44_9BACT|nr:hypothetical protein [Niastella vici]OQP62547.1 hypothetical protein A3860_28055 [Niastella vici]